jgi:beta-galactosidase
MKVKVFFIICVLAASSSARTNLDFDFNWRFAKDNFATAEMAAFDDSSWRTVNLPHDWSIEGPFSAEYGSGNGYAPGGVGWYRKHFKLDEIDKDKFVTIEFDGVYNNSEVWINGLLVGRRPYGYSSFQYDLTPHLKFGADENIIAVRVDHSKFADSRWYTGSGIYRHVRLRVNDKLRIKHWGTYITTPEVNNDSAVIHIERAIKNDYEQAKEFLLQSDIVTTDGQIVASRSAQGTLDPKAEQNLVQEIKIDNPQLWSIENPVLYTLRSSIKQDDRVIDEVTTAFGIRTIIFDPNKGFFLNGKSTKLKGVCLHHDAGCLGAAVPEKVLERRLRLIKELGANAIRTSHNPPAPELLDICDRLGLLVKDEAFDEFTPPKNKWMTGWNNGEPSRFGYGEDFLQWSVTDIQDMVRRDRNHPCIIMWSIGNEIDYRNDPFSHPVLGNNYRPEQPPAENMVKYAKPLIEAVKKLDKTRPVTAALATIEVSNAIGLAQMLDVVGYNYQEKFYETDHKNYPKRVIFGSENGDEYNNWAVVRDNDYVAGQFLWTGIDYLGEAGRWPNTANGAGLLDLCGFKKPIGWFRQSLWSDKPMVYIYASGNRGGGGRGRGRGARGTERWNWPEGTSVNVLCYTNCTEVSLVLNNNPIGTKSYSEARNGLLTWTVSYAPGELKAVGLNNGQGVCEYSLRTTGPASRIELLPDTNQIHTDGKDICHVEFRITDDKGVLVQDADNEVVFEVQGPGNIIGIGNGNLNNIEDYKDNKHKAYNGRGLAILQSKFKKPGKIKIKATSEGLHEASTEIEVME